MGVQDNSARIGWDDFVKYSDLVDPTKGFMSLGEILVEVEFAPSHGRLEKVREAQITGCTLQDGMKSLFKSKVFSDVKLLVDGEEFDAHRAALASRSEVFEAMFNASMTETATNSVTIGDISAETMKLLLQFIYTDTFAAYDVQPAVIGDLLKAAQKYQISRLSRLCEKKAVEALTLESVLDWLMLGTMVEAPELKSACMRFVRENLAEVQLTPGWKRMLADKQLMTEVVPSIIEMICPPAKRLKCE